MGECDHKLIAKSLDRGLGLQLTHSLVNHHRAKNELEKVTYQTVWRSARSFYGGICHNRPNKKTGSKDVDSTWAKARHAIGLQLQQQFCEGDRECEYMVGTTVVKLFDGKPYVGTITR